MSIKKRSAANQAIVEMLKEQQQQNNDSLNSSTEKTESQKNLEKESKKEMEQYKNSKEYQTLSNAVLAAKNQQAAIQNELDATTRKLADLKNENNKSVIILEPQSYKDIKDKLSDKNITCIYLYANNSTIKKRLEKRGDNPNEVIRRMESDNEDFKGFENEVDRIVYNNDGDKIDDVVSKIFEYIGGLNENN